jgi:hypothetical protein
VHSGCWALVAFGGVVSSLISHSPSHQKSDWSQSAIYSKFIALPSHQASSVLHPTPQVLSLCKIFFRSGSGWGEVGYPNFQKQKFGQMKEDCLKCRENI